MENTQESLSDKENSAENRRITFIQRQLTPLLAAISMVELPSSEEDENENSDSADESSETEMNQAKRATTCSETEMNRTKGTNTCSETEMDWTKGATTCSETEMNRTKGATTCSETDQPTNTTNSNQSWEELTRQERDYFNQLEQETQEKEEESAQWCPQHPSNRGTKHGATNCLRGKNGKAYKFNCITSNLDQLAYTSDISNAAACVEALFRSHMYMAITTMQWCDTKMQPDFNMIIWIDWDLNKIKDHGQTTKTHMERVEDGQKKERKLYHLSNDGKAFFLSYALQALQVHDDRYISRYGLQLKRDKFLFTQGKQVRYVL